MAWATSITALSKPVEGGHTTQSKMEQLRAVWKQTKVKPPELEAIPEPPRDLLYLWEWLGDQMYPLSYAELTAWQGLTRRRLARWEVEVMMRLDRVRSHG